MAADIKNNKDRIPLEHYKRIFAQKSAEEIALRCGLPYDPAKGAFTIRLMGREYLVSHPDFEIVPLDGKTGEKGLDNQLAYQILALRYLTDGCASEGKGEFITYREVPWGEVYYPNFHGRCILRLTYAFGFKLAELEKVMQTLRAEKTGMGDVSYRFEFLNGLYLCVIFWEGDDEFPPSCQILFSDNFVLAFTAEDMAVVGDVMIDSLKTIQNGIKT